MTRHENCPACEVEASTGEKAPGLAHVWRALTVEEAQAAFDRLHPSVQCQLLGHDWPTYWEVVRLRGTVQDAATSYRRRACPRCGATEARA